jgi:hypothetical protein
MRSSIHPRRVFEIDVDLCARWQGDALPIPDAAFDRLHAVRFLIAGMDDSSRKQGEGKEAARQQPSPDAVALVAHAFERADCRVFIVSHHPFGVYQIGLE